MKASEIAKEIGCTSRTVRRWTERGLVPCVREKTKGGNYRYADTPALREWIASKKAEREINPESADKINNLYAEFKKRTASLARHVTGMVNDAYKSGVQLQIMCDRKRMSFKFWQSNCEGQLPLDFKTAKFLMSLAGQMPQETDELSEAIRFYVPLMKHLERLNKLSASKSPAQVTPLSTK